MNPTTYYLYDPQGAVAQTFDADSAAQTTRLYDAWGNLMVGTQPSTDPYGYNGQWGYYKDSETSLLLLTHRYYDPARGRFFTRDPIGYAGGMNLYGYVGNNPTSYADPSGLKRDWLDCMAACIEANDPLNLLVKGLISGIGGSIPKSLIRAFGFRVVRLPGSSNWTCLPSAASAYLRLGAGGLLRRLGTFTNGIWLVYGNYMAIVEIRCAWKCFWDPRAY